MMGRGGGRKERSNVDYSSSYGERERRSGWGIAPPSRKLWVGNLSPDITESILSEHFLRFGEIESITYSSGRSFAYINFKKEEDAVLALRGLQGSNVSGMPLRIEFAKGDKDYLQHKGDRFSTERAESHFRRELRSEHVSPERSSDKSKGYKSAEISEVLWVGFPSFLNVDEMMLRRAFSPFGEIEKITTFPGRSYAFVRYRSVVAACRAKEALHGKLFNNPRVSICFARSDIPAEHGKDFARSPVRSNSKLNFLPGSSGQVFEAFPGDRSFESPVRELHRASPPYGSHFDRVPRDAHALDFERNNSFRFSAERGPVGAEAYGYTRLRDFNKDRILEDVYERQRSSPEERVRSWRNLSSERPHRVPHLLDSLNAEDRSFPLAKKLKIDYIPDKDLPEYPFSDLEPEKHDALQKQFTDFPEHHGYNKALDSISDTLKGANDHSRNLIRTRVEIDGSRNSIHSLSVGARPLPMTSKLPIFISEAHKAPALDNIWKWEGTLAKGGTPVCRARCFPVGKVLDFMLPEFLNCTARTGLDMLAKHYYQAAGTWVVFFVPETDADISFTMNSCIILGISNELLLLNWAKKVTLFLVPPSDFSEQVLKVPGKVSISGVVLKFQQNAPKLTSVLQPMNVMDQKVSSIIHRPNEVLNFHESLAFSA
ncbi:hypothetical protein HPP92_021918 [Vanilla planifolia]|uniref:RRM domain-containing protein n=1 Tax=Vanilla planifolia TaxID=51239 RepID=A0A835UJF9_VANPL|nr:hypothetical protein HPP92_021918 [Vanilla planifolia]